MWSDSIANQQTVYPHSHIPFRNCVALLLWLFVLGLQQNTYLGLFGFTSVHERQDICQDHTSGINRQAILTTRTALPPYFPFYSHPQCSSDARFSPLGDG